MVELTSFSQEEKSIHVAVVTDLSQRLLSTEVCVGAGGLLFFHLNSSFKPTTFIFLRVTRKRGSDFISKAPTSGLGGRKDVQIRCTFPVLTWMLTLP